MNKRPIIRFFIIPSFTPESILDIEFDRTTKKYMLVYQVCDKNIWYNKNIKQVKITRKSKEIAIESVTLINSLFETAIQGVKYIEEPVLRCDGENYFFTVNKLGIKTGKTWSPNKNTKMKRLVNIGLDLVKIANSEDTITKLNDNLKLQIIQLTNDLNVKTIK